ncbi:MAG: hypothetical protein ACXAES_03055 [Promethearchaeota archaeon]|jgi:hypothetical protein
MSEYQEFMVFEIEDSGDKNKIAIDKGELSYYLHPEKVLLIVREDIRRIYLWKGAQSSVRKRFLGSRIATEVQGELMKSGYHRCKIVSIDQGDEAQEFLNVFGLESMEVEEKLEDKVILSNSARERLEQQKILETKVEFSESSKPDEIKQFLDADEKILWIKSVSQKISLNWVKSLLKNKRYRNRVKRLAKLDKVEKEIFEKREVITNKKIITNNRFNEIYDFSGISDKYFKWHGQVSILDINGLRSFEIQEVNGMYDVCFNAEPEKSGACVFLFDGLSREEYNNLIDILTIEFPFKAEIPTEIGKLTFARRK